jgi:hypothetical protein
VARRSSPPAANAAVDGFGFAQAATGAGPQHLPLLPGRAAAGQPYDGAVPPGAAQQDAERRFKAYQDMALDRHSGESRNPEK